MKVNYLNELKDMCTEEFIIIRLLGEDIYSFTEGLEEPIYKIFKKSILLTSKYLKENIKNCEVSYVDSNEITLLLKNSNTSITNLTSIAQNLATLIFNKIFKELSYSLVTEEITLNLLKHKFNVNVFKGEWKLLRISNKEMKNYFLLQESLYTLEKLFL